MGEGQHAMLRAYSTNEVDYVGSDAAAHAWAECDVLLTQPDGPG